MKKTAPTMISPIDARTWSAIDPQARLARVGRACARVEPMHPQRGEVAGVDVRASPSKWPLTYQAYMPIRTTATIHRPTIRSARQEGGPDRERVGDEEVAQVV